MQHWPGTQHLQVAVRMADGRAESVGDSLARWLFFEEGVPAPELQHEVRDRLGARIGTTDFAWPRHRSLGEFDGAVEYQRLLRPGQRAEDVVVEEKRREDRLREATRWGMVRIVWSDLERPPRHRRAGAGLSRRVVSPGSHDADAVPTRRTSWEARGHRHPVVGGRRSRAGRPRTRARGAVRRLRPPAAPRG